jgi:hypothetical protein
MLSAAEIKAAYREALQQRVTVRRYTGAGANRPRFDAEDIRANARAFGSDELIGGIVQGDTKVILLVEDIIAAQMRLPLTTADKIVTKGRELAIQTTPKERKALDGTLVAYELHCRG